MTDQPTDEGTTANPSKIIQNIATPDRPTENVGHPPPKPRIIKHESRAGDLRLTYSISEDNLATNPELMKMLIERLSGIMFFCAVSESVASHVLGDFQTMLDEFRMMFSGKPEEKEEA